MKSLLVALLTVVTFQSTFALSANHADGISISAKATPDELFIDVNGDVTGKVSVSVFSQMGEIVLTKELSAGSNSISVKTLAAGSYIAVVRENDSFKQKVEFQVN